MMFDQNTLRAVTMGLAGLALSVGCDQQQRTVKDEAVGTAESEITNVAHTEVERQSIGNCWLYAQASWVESMHLSYVTANAGGGEGEGNNTCAHNLCTEGEALPSDCSSCATSVCEADTYCCEQSWDQYCVALTEEVCDANACNEADPATPPTPVEELDVSQSYWTYWHWFDQVTGFMRDDEISTGGNQWKSHSIVRDRGVMAEKDFVPEDVSSEMSNRQSAAKNKINTALKSGELKTSEARRDGKLVRKVFDEAWGLSDEVRQQMDKVFGEDGEGTLRHGGSIEGTNIIDPATLPVRYTAWNGEQAEVKDTTLLEAVRAWNTVHYPRVQADRRAFLQRIQRALHDGQPVVITWDVEFNAMENGDNPRRGSFNLKTLQEAGKPGRQGGHMTVLADYAAETEEFGLLEAGVTLDPNNPDDAARLEAALLPSTKITLLRTKNSWGALRPDRAFAKDYPGYHDLWMDYLDGPIKFCPRVASPTNANCHGESIPLNSVMLPPGY